jgi:eukaryotic-like serine/threonine-protein kinase
MRIGQYAVHMAIASGGMASVHFGRFTGAAGFARTVAIKRMHPHLCNDPEFVAMFVDEARLAARIRHPNVVPTLDVLATAGELLIVMDYVHGEPLVQLARCVHDRKERIGPAIASAVLVDLLAGLHAAHEATDERGESLGIIHRDVSPENILVGLDGSARVLDFGVAKAIGRLQVTREGQLKGKIAYMAPEQVRGGAIDRRTDVYAASVVLWQLLTGRRLFEGSRDGELVEKILYGTIDAPSTVAPHVPEALNGIVLRGLARDPAERFPTARDMARALREAVRPASASELTDWVEANAGEVLAARASTLATIDREQSGDGAPAGRSDSAEAPAPSADADRLAVVLHTDVQGSAPPAATGPASDRRARLRRAGMVVAGIAAIGAVSVLVARGNHPIPLQPTRLGASEALGEGSTLTPGPPPESTPSPSTPDHPTALVYRGTTPPTSSALSSKPLGSAAPPARKRSTAQPPSGMPGRTSCDPPYTTDEDGTRIYKMQCL